MSIWRSSTTAILIAGVVVVVIAAAVSFMFSHFQPRTEVRLSSGVFHLRLAADEPSREKGLSGVESLKSDDGLLMTFDTDDKWAIWMKDMKIPLDIVWLDSSKKVIYIVKNAAPELSTDRVFTPTEKARYVIELSAGATQQYGIKLGDRATFNEQGGQ